MTQEFSFNLIDEAWLPCISLKGETKMLSLRQVLTQAHQLRLLSADSPLQNAALHRLLLAILHRVFGPKDGEGWYKLWEEPNFAEAELNAYLNQWQSRFDLFGQEHPFYQASLPQVKSRSIIGLNHDRAAGLNATLFDHHTEDGGETLRLDQATRALVTMQAFGLAGLSGIKGENFSDGTCASGIIFLVEGDDLKQTLLLNLIIYPPKDFFTHTEGDRPVWEMENPFERDSEIPLGYLDYLTWQNRRISLKPENINGEMVVRSMTMRPGLLLTTPSENTLDPMKHYRKDEKLGFLSTHFRENKVLWRDSATFLSFQEKDTEKTPRTFAWLRELVHKKYLKRQQVFRSSALGMSKTQAKVNFFREERLPLPLAYFDDDSLINNLQTALEKTAGLASDLIQVMRQVGMFLQTPDADNKKWGELNTNAKADINDWIAYTGLERHYWTSLDTPFQTFMVDLYQKDQEEVMVAWFELLEKTARNTFEQATQYVGIDGKSFKALEQGWRYLNSRLRERFPKEETVQETG